jgi:hypothetical protein
LQKIAADAAGVTEDVRARPAGAKLARCACRRMPRWSRDTRNK